jgi:SAM-dependent methyltransferase
MSDAANININTVALDLGCGTKPKNFFQASKVFGIDVRDDLSNNIVKADLVLSKIPFNDESFDFITAHDFLEHIPRIIYIPERRTPFIELMSEIWRVLKPGGKFLSQTPAFPQPAAFCDPTHVNFITEQTFTLYFCGDLWAKGYGFKGKFGIISQQWNGPHLISILEKLTEE